MIHTEENFATLNQNCLCKDTGQKINFCYLYQPRKRIGKNLECTKEYLLLSFSPLCWRCKEKKVDNLTRDLWVVSESRYDFNDWPTYEQLQNTFYVNQFNYNLSKQNIALAFVLTNRFGFGSLRPVTFGQYMLQRQNILMQNNTFKIRRISFLERQAG